MDGLPASIKTYVASIDGGCTMLPSVDSDHRQHIFGRNIPRSMLRSTYFGLHGWTERADALTKCSITSLEVPRGIRFGASTAKLTTDKLWTSGQFELRSNRPACRGQRCAVPTAPASAHLTTAFNYGSQNNSNQESQKTHIRRFKGLGA